MYNFLTFLTLFLKKCKIIFKNKHFDFNWIFLLNKELTKFPGKTAKNWMKIFSGYNEPQIWSSAFVFVDYVCYTSRICIFSSIGCILFERLFACIYVKKYEKKRNILVILGSILIEIFCGCLVAYFIVYSKFFKGGGRGSSFQEKNQKIRQKNETFSNFGGKNHHYAIWAVKFSIPFMLVCVCKCFYITVADSGAVFPQHFWFLYNF